MGIPFHTNLKSFRQCEDDLAEAVYAARDWFQCQARVFWGRSFVAYSPLGLEACLDKGHAPCEDHGSWFWPYHGK